jgi:synaptotagmin-like protein
VVSTRGEGEKFAFMCCRFPLSDWILFVFLHAQSEPFEDVTTYRGDIIVGLKFIPGADSSGSSHSHGLSLRKFSIKSNSSASSGNNGSGTGPTSCSKNTKGSLHIMVKEAKHLSPVKANGNCDAFCKRWVEWLMISARGMLTD